MNETVKSTKVTKKIDNTIAQLPDGSTFGYQEFNIQEAEYPAATKAIERLIKKGIINRASTGLFYKPKQTVFGNLKPKEEELLKPYLCIIINKITIIISTPIIYLTLLLYKKKLVIYYILYILDYFIILNQHLYL